MLNKRIILLLSVFTAFIANAQEDIDESAVRQGVIEQRIEAIVETLSEDEELDYLVLFDELSYFYEHKLDLNRATPDELRSIYMLSEIQINNLMRHIERYGKLDSMYELQAVKGFDLESIYSIMPFVKVGQTSQLGRQPIKTILREGRSDLFVRYQETLEEQKGFSAATDQELADNPNSRFLGSAARVYTRYRFTYRNNLSIGVTAEKDPGEEFFKGTQKNGFDFYSAHIFYRDKGLVRAMAIGDFQAQFGQGLALWSGLGFGKSAFIANVKRSARGLLAYTSVDENRFMRGGAVTLGKGKFEGTAMYSRKHVDANLDIESDTLDSDEFATITSLQLSGFHRTEAELFDKDAIEEIHIGGNVNFKNKGLKVGATALQTDYRANLVRNLNIYNQFDFNSNSNFVSSFDYNYIKRNFNFFGEFARSSSGGIATINGALIAVHPNLSFSVLHRYFERNFHSILANSWGESSRPANERGLFMGFDATLKPRWRLAGYFDRFDFDWLSYQTDAPSHGYDGLLQLTHKPSKKNEFYVRYRHRARDRNLTLDEELIDYPTELIRSSLRFNAAYQVSETVKMKTRVEKTVFDQEGLEEENGFLLSQDITWKKLSSPVSFSARYALFDASYNARIYSYESDVLYAFSIPAYFDRGSRVYLLMKYHVRRGMDVWVRWAQWNYNNRDVISSGLNEINGNKRSEIKVQLRWRF